MINKPYRKSIYSEEIKIDFWFIDQNNNLQIYCDAPVEYFKDLYSDAVATSIHIECKECKFHPEDIYTWFSPVKIGENGGRLYYNWFPCSLSRTTLRRIIKEYKEAVKNNGTGSRMQELYPL